jgi:hypothetical protein
VRACVRRLWDWVCVWGGGHRGAERASRGVAENQSNLGGLCWNSINNSVGM